MGASLAVDQSCGASKGAKSGYFWKKVHQGRKDRICSLEECERLRMFL